MSTSANPPSLDLHSTALLLSAPKVMPPAANDNRQPWKGPRREGKKKKGQGTVHNMWRADGTRREPWEEALKWCTDWAWQWGCIILRVTLRPSRTRTVHQRLSAAPADCAASPAPLMKGDDGPAVGGKANTAAESSTQGDGKVIALIKWLWLAGGRLC